MNNQIAFILCAGSTVLFVVAWFTMLRVIKISFRNTKILYALCMFFGGVLCIAAIEFITEESTLFGQPEALTIFSCWNGFWLLTAVCFALKDRRKTSYNKFRLTPEQYEIVTQPHAIRTNLPIQIEDTKAKIDYLREKCQNTTSGILKPTASEDKTLLNDFLKVLGKRPDEYFWLQLNYEKLSKEQLLSIITSFMVVIEGDALENLYDKIRGNYKGN